MSTTQKSLSNPAKSLYLAATLGLAALGANRGDAKPKDTTRPGAVTESRVSTSPLHQATQAFYQAENPKQLQ